jgi:erythromycin esterase-like protein
MRIKSTLARRVYADRDAAAAGGPEADLIVRRISTLDAIRSEAHELGDTPSDFDPLLRLVGDRAFVLLGEASHGTHEFYAMRARISRRLIEEHGFDAVVVEADWPDAYRLNRYVRGAGDASVDEAFGDFQRFPTWMWRNQDVRAFIEWLHAHNARAADSAQVGFYGMDLYSLYRSAVAVVDYLQGVDPDQAKAAQRLYVGLDHVRDAQDYGYEAAYGLRPSCRDDAAAMLTDLVRNRQNYVSMDGKTAQDEQFFAERNAYVVLNAEHYYRAMFSGRSNTWNLRDAHMVNTLAALRKHLQAGGRKGRIVVWAHNSHLGDASATQMGERGEWNVGQLLREQFGPGQCLLVGFTTYTGHVTAARDWDAPAERRWVRPARADSCEHLLHETGRGRFFLSLGDALAEPLAAPLLQRAIGVIYRPETELASHYFRTSLSAQFDALIHVDQTTAVEPFDISEHWTQHESPETYPFGL